MSGYVRGETSRNQMLTNELCIAGCNVLVQLKHSQKALLMRSWWFDVWSALDVDDYTAAERAKDSSRFSRVLVTRSTREAPLYLIPPEDLGCRKCPKLTTAGSDTFKELSADLSARPDTYPRVATTPWSMFIRNISLSPSFDICISPVMSFSRTNGQFLVSEPLTPSSVTQNRPTVGEPSCQQSDTVLVLLLP